MDLSVSPDLAAYLCYGIVFLLGIVVAVVQVAKRLGGMDGAWFVARTWVLFTGYAAVPVVLFWLLDRTGAITDTSLFAAVLVGIGYERIITGGSQNLRAPGDVSAFWTPFVAYADQVAKVVLERGAQNQSRLAERIIAEIMKAPERYNKLEAVALARSSNVAATQAALAEFEDAQGGGPADKMEKKTRYLYASLLSIPDVHYLLKSKEVISSEFYWQHVKRLGPLVLLVAMAILALVSLERLVFAYYPDFREVAVIYDVWRLGKTNSTAVDQYRSRRHLVGLMERDGGLKQKATDRLVYLVQKPGLPMERVDLVLQTLLESTTRSPNKDLPAKLVQALRGASLDARTRVKESLVFLAASCAKQPETALTDWKPTERDSSTTLEQKIRGWNHHWTQVCSS